MTTIEQKEMILATIRTNAQGIIRNTMYRDMLKFDDLFNKCELGSEIRRLDYRIKNQQALMDKKALEYQKLGTIQWF